MPCATSKYRRTESITGACLATPAGKTDLDYFVLKFLVLKFRTMCIVHVYNSKFERAQTRFLYY